MSVTIKQRLDNFSQAFDEAAQGGMFNNLNAEGRQSVKDELSKTMVNWSERISTGNAIMGGQGFYRDPFECVGNVIESTLETAGKPENFSNNLGGIQSQNISTLMLMAQYKSYGLSHIFNVTGMEHPKTLFNFQQLSAENDFGMFRANDVMIDQRYSSHPMVQFTGRGVNAEHKDADSGAAGTLDTKVEYGKPIRIKTITLEGKNANGKWEVLGFDSPNNNHEGKLLMKTQVAKEIKINYDSGEITIDTPVAVNGITDLRFTAFEDLTKNPAGKPPTFYASNDHIELEAYPHFFSLRQNIEDIVRMNKEYQINKPNGIASSYAKTTISQLMNLYIKNIDTDIMTTLLEPYIPYILSLDAKNAQNLAGWQVGGNTNLLETRMAQMFANVEAEMSGRCDGRRPTAVVADTVGCVALMSNRHFQRSGPGFAYSDGLIGSLYGVDVIRSRVLDFYTAANWKNNNPINIFDQLSKNISLDASEQLSTMIFVHKDAANKTASGVMGTYIPPYATNGQLERGGMNIVHTIETEYVNALVLPQLAIPVVVRTSGSPDFKYHDLY